MPVFLYLLLGPGRRWVRDWIAGVLADRPTVTSRPSELVRQGIIRDCVIWLGGGVIGAILAGLTFGLTGASLPYGFFFGLCLGLTVSARYLIHSPWPRYLIATRELARRSQIPRRLARFLDWAYGAGLLRMSGVSAQFRHRELQDHLVTAFTVSEGEKASRDNANEVPV